MGIWGIKRIFLLTATVLVYRPGVECAAQEMPLTGARFSMERPLPDSFPGAFYLPADTQSVRTLIRQGDSLIRYDPDSAVGLLKQAEQKCLRAGYYDGAALARIKMGLAAIATEDFKQSFLHYATAYRYARRARNYKQLIPLIYTDIGTLFNHMRLYEEAVTYYLQALEFLEKHAPEHTNRIIVLGNLAAILINTGRYNEADNYLEQAAVLARKKKDDYYLAYTLANRAGAILGKKEYGEAMSRYREAVYYARKAGNKELEQGILTGMGQVMLAAGHPDSAVIYIRRALQVPVPAYSYYSTLVPYHTLGIALYRAGKLREAEQALLSGLKRERKTDLTEEKIQAAGTLAAIYEQTGRLREALQQTQHYIRLKDSVLDKEKLQAVSQLEIKYRTAQKDKELAEKQLLILSQYRQIERKNVWIAGAAASAGLLAIVLFTLYRSSRHRQKIVALKAMMAGEERERIRVAQDLHDGVGGMLAAVQMRLSGMEGADAAAIKEMVRETAGEIRKTAHNLMPDIIQRYDLEEALQIYCATINRSGRGLHVELQVHEPLPVLDKSRQLSLYRILQEIIQNIVKHAQAELAVVQLSLQDGKLNIIVEDNGTGFHPETVKKGLGISNMQLRVEMLQGTISIESSPGRGATVNITVPL